MVGSTGHFRCILEPKNFVAIVTQHTLLDYGMLMIAYHNYKEHEIVGFFCLWYTALHGIKFHS